MKKKTNFSSQITTAALPEHFGFATSLFQDCGLGTKASATDLAGKCDWDRWLTPSKIEGTEQGDYKKFFFDCLSNPEPLIDCLKKMGVTAHRFSLEWSVIEPEEGVINDQAIALYQNLIDQLLENGIEPYVTACHFTLPEHFAKKGGFEKLENIAIYKNHVLKMMNTFERVKYWIPFNEINIDATQRSIRGVYPPGQLGDIAMAAKRMRHMFIAHCQIYREAKQRWNDLQIGSTHQWLKFEPLEGNLLEEVICYFLSKIFHYCCYQFFNSGKFKMDIPILANIQFEIPDDEFIENQKFCDFVGVQWYGFPKIKAGFNGGKEYPGYKIQNIHLGPLGGLTFGATCAKGGRVMSFGPSFYPESLDTCLKEAEALQKPLMISEWGCDARSQGFEELDFRLDFEAQKEFYERCFPIFQKHREKIQALFNWTIAQNNLEWERGNFPMLGVIQILKDEKRNIVGWKPSLAALFLQKIFQQKRAELKEKDNLIELF